MAGIVQTTETNTENIWQDREIRFDVPIKELECRRGEFLIDHMESVEDTKGNNGEKGQLFITNLRMVWQCDRNRRTNLSIGYNSVSSINIRTATSKLRGQAQALYVMTKFNNARFEFIFTNLVRDSPRLFTTVQAVFRAYDTTKLYRDLKLRGAIIDEKELKLLPNEQTYSKVHGVWNLSSETGSLGTFYITNVRLVWFANAAEAFNVSVPYLQMKSVRVRDSKFGPALVLETTARSGGYILGFRVDPLDRLKEVFKEIQSLWQLFSVNPVFGIEWKMEDTPESLDKLTVARKQDDVEIVEAEGRDAIAAYFADESSAAPASGAEREAVYSTELGLAIEKPPEGVTVEQLWNLL